ncbi:MAG: hypothetical protein A3H28_02710 [Acidobacteria bacterium RIFCSPLOWO2_02_FULL_61_28]|nr:MAG: hypothetical protein A3H28_02710 [Acidobacteria bacterium RIFCSPLOWO2_02_FULL_61_28]
MAFRICDYAHRLTSDIDPTTGVKVGDLDGLLNRCTVRATEALKGQASGYSESDRNYITSIFEAMQHTHNSIRILVNPEEPKPTSVDALLLARVQLESLYAICLMLEDAKWVGLYIKDGWKKFYKRFLLEKEESRDLPRLVGFPNEMQPHIDNLTHISGVTEAERRTVEEEELGISLPSGITKAKIDRFPTPKGIISKVNDQHRKQMLIRMYAEYEHLSSYVHALPDAIDFKRMFGKYRDRYPTKGIDGAFQKQVVGPSLIISFLSVIQSASELTCLYPCDIELSATVTEAWNLLTKYSLLGKVIWEIRAKTLLGSIQ